MTTKLQYETTKSDLQQRIAAIDALFPVDVAYTDKLYTYIPGGLRCKHCGCPHLNMVTADHRVASCQSCGRITRPTAGTYFHGTREIKNWVRVLMLLEQGIVFSANLFALLSDLSTSTVDMMLKKIRFSILQTMESDKTALSAELMSAVCKRSNKTVADDHPVSEQDEFELAQRKEMGWDTVQTLIARAVNQPSGSPPQKSLEAADCESMPKTVETAIKSISLVQSGGTNSSQTFDNELEIYKLLTFKPVAHEELLHETALTATEAVASLVNLELGKLVESRVNTWFNIKRNALPMLAKDPAAPTYDVAPFINFLKSKFHGVSRKYIQLFYADYSCQLHKRGTGALLSLVMKRKKVSWRQIRHYVSPPVVTIIE